MAWPAAVVDQVLDAVVFTDVEIPGVAGRVTADFRGILHRNQLGRAGAHRQFLHALIGHAGALVPVSMEGEQSPIVIVDETRVDFVLHGVGLAAELGAHVGNLDRLAVFILALKGDLVGLGLPLPGVSSFEESGDFSVPGVADGLDLVPRIDTVGLGDLIENWRALSAPRSSRARINSSNAKAKDGSQRVGPNFSWRSLLGELNEMLRWMSCRGFPDTEVVAIGHGVGRPHESGAKQSLRRPLPRIRIPAA